MFVNDYLVWSIDECLFIPREANVIAELFPGIPASIDSVFRYTNGYLYFIQNNMYFEYDEFTSTVISSGHMNLDFFGISCPNESILQQLKNLLSKIISNNVKL
jgi:hypothetical protein